MLSFSFMPRTACIDILGLFQHVMVRGIEKRDIFLKLPFLICESNSAPWGTLNPQIDANLAVFSAINALVPS